MPYLGNVPAEAYTNTVKDSFNGDGSTTAFTLSQPSTTNNLRVVVENVIQDPTVAYTVSGTTLTFTSAPPSGTANIYAVHLGPAVQTVVPPTNIEQATTYTSDLTVQGAFTSQGIDDNADATAITIDSIENVGIGTTSITNFANYKVLELGAGSAGNIISLRNTGGSSTFHIRGNASGSSYTIESRLGTNAPLIFGYNETPKIRIDGDGLKFNSDTAAANALDDYEEGTFNCSINDGSTTPTQTQYGYYTKIGNMCHVYGQTTITGSSSGGSILRFSLPFSTTNAARGGIAVGLNQPIAVSGNDIDLHLVAELNTNVVYIVSTDPAGGHTHLTFNNLGYGLFSFAGTFTVA